MLTSPASPDAFPHAPCDGLILAGGAGRRVGGQDKGWLRWQGEALIQHATARLSPQVDRVLISANRSLEQYARLGHPVLCDLRDGFCGPLAGVEAGLLSTRADLLLCVPCDAPGFPLDLRTRLEAALTESDDAAVVSLNGRLQPVFALLRVHTRTRLREYLDAGGRKVGAWLGSLSLRPVDFSDQAEAFENRNHPESLDPATS
ncbi:molybdenum cofactor guanylyltransferase MobA [Niveibacterium sp. SC-1]|uniref:molybdenum cofactor guanylyltransferase MobA n=1 Tax=Niveibacterium sp. SC-1 TaxID=3135646 RepID=UPI00311D694F